MLSAPSEAGRGRCAVKLGAKTGQVQWGSLAVTFYGTSAHQVGEGEMQWPFRGEVGLGQGPYSLTHLQKQLSAWSAHSPSPGQLQAGREAMVGRPLSIPDTTLLRGLQSVQQVKLLLPRTP